jgi:peptidoglycan hydrolase-like protein with peptidoglycan-binding domain
MQELQNLEQQLIALEFKANSCSLTFGTNLSQGMTSSAVKDLQTVLNYTPLTQVATTGPGSPNNESTYFGNATKNAVIAFQNIFADQILTPNGMTSGNGYVGASTRSVLKGLCGQ